MALLGKSGDFDCQWFAPGGRLADSSEQVQEGAGNIQVSMVNRKNADFSLPSTRLKGFLLKNLTSNIFLKSCENWQHIWRFLDFARRRRRPPPIFPRQYASPAYHCNLSTVQCVQFSAMCLSQEVQNGTPVQCRYVVIQCSCMVYHLAVSSASCWHMCQGGSTRFQYKPNIDSCQETTRLSP